MYLFIYLLSFLGPHLWHMEVSRLGVELELEPPLYAIAMATRIQATSVTSSTAHSHALSYP